MLKHGWRPLALAVSTLAAVECARTEPQCRCEAPPVTAIRPAPPAAPVADDLRPPAPISHDATCAAALPRGFPGPGERFDAASVVGLQDLPAGGTPDGTSLLVQRGRCSVQLTALVVDEIPPGSGLYRSRGIRPIAELDLSHEEGVTMESDGLTIIAMSSTARRFRAARRSGPGKTDFAVLADDDFSQIVAVGPTQQLWAPSISPDGLAFYYSVVNDPDAGIYESLRSTTHEPFPPGRPMPDLVQGLAQYVNGVSPDHLTIFLELKEGFGAFVLTRANTREPFQNPNAPAPPPRLPGLRTRPLGSCNRLIGTCTPLGGACPGEDVCLWVN
jgi:hypothetical protein